MLKIWNEYNINNWLILLRGTRNAKFDFDFGWFENRHWAVGCPFFGQVMSVQRVAINLSGCVLGGRLIEFQASIWATSVLRWDLLRRFDVFKVLMYCISNSWSRWIFGRILSSSACSSLRCLAIGSSASDIFCSFARCASCIWSFRCKFKID